MKTKSFSLREKNNNVLKGGLGRIK